MSTKELRSERLMDALTVAPHARINGVRTRRLNMRPKFRASRLWAPETSQTCVYSVSGTKMLSQHRGRSQRNTVSTWRAYSSLLVCSHQFFGGPFRICYTSGFTVSSYTIGCIYFYLVLR